MKTTRKENIGLIILAQGEYMPKTLEPGTLYYSPEFATSSHLCLCGCGHICALPIKTGEWSLLAHNGKPTVAPSIQQRFECKSHYIIIGGVANFV